MEMKSMIGKLLGLVAFFFIAHTACAAEHGSRDEAVTMVKKAAAYLKANGKEKAFAEFSNPKGMFVDRDLYITVYDMSGKALAHGANPRMVGKDMIDLRDADGKYIVKDRIAIAKEKGSGWQDFKWVNPVTKAMDRKTMYFERVEDVIISCGVYKY
jgi:signal transduction histidine kinase